MRLQLATLRYIKLKVQDYHLKMSLKYDTGQIAVFWENLGHKHFVNMDCDTTLAFKHTPQALRNLKLINPALSRVFSLDLK